VIVFNETKINEVAQTPVKSIPELVRLYNRKPFPMKRILFISDGRSTIRYVGKFALTSSETDDFFTLRGLAGGLPVLEVPKYDFDGALIYIGVRMDIYLKSGSSIAIDPK